MESDCASYVAVPVINHVLRNENENAQRGSSLSKNHSSTGVTDTQNS